MQVIVQNHLKIFHLFKEVFNIFAILFKDAQSWTHSVAQKDLTGSQLEHVSDMSVQEHFLDSNIFLFLGGAPLMGQ